MPLLRYPYLEYDGRKTMRSLADALTKLRELGNLSDRENVEIKTMGIRLPDGRLSGIVSVLGPQQQDGTRRIIFMPSSATFSARTTWGTASSTRSRNLTTRRAILKAMLSWLMANSSTKSS